MNEESANTSGSQPDEEKPAPIADLSSLAATTAAILTALTSPEEIPSVSSATSQSQTETNSSSLSENVDVKLTTEVVTKNEAENETKQEIQNETKLVTKTKEKKMKTKKIKAEKKLTVARMLQRLDKVLTFKRLSVKMTRWLEDEKDEARRLDLQTLKDRFDAIVLAQDEIRTRANNLQTVGYVPPKKNFSGAMQLEHGRHVWVKPKFMEAYTVSMPKESLENLFVDKVVGGNVVVSVGSPDEEVAFKFPVPKLRLQVSSPSA